MVDVNSCRHSFLCPETFALQYHKNKAVNFGQCFVNYANHKVFIIWIKCESEFREKFASGEKCNYRSQIYLFVSTK